MQLHLLMGYTHGCQLLGNALLPSLHGCLQSGCQAPGCTVQVLPVLLMLSLTCTVLPGLLRWPPPLLRQVVCWVGCWLLWLRGCGVGAA